MTSNLASEEVERIASPSADDLAPLDIRHGLQSLADFIRKDYRQTYHLVATKQIPAKKLGGEYTWSPSQVRAVIMGGLE